MKDPRCISTAKLAPPKPLPYVSRKALKRIKHPATIPTTCPNCGCGVELVNNAAIYGREYGEWPFAYLCTNWQSDCGAYVGLHPNTDIPLGTLATKPLRTARSDSKKLFNQLWQSGYMDRKEAYAWLAGMMGLSEAECHFGLFDVDQCKRSSILSADRYLELDSGEKKAAGWY